MAHSIKVQRLHRGLKNPQTLYIKTSSGRVYRHRQLVDDNMLAKIRFSLGRHDGATTTANWIKVRG